MRFTEDGEDVIIIIKMEYISNEIQSINNTMLSKLFVVLMASNDIKI